MQATAEDPRKNILNRTMIVSKRSRRPGLPEVDASSNNNENAQPNAALPASEIKMPNSARTIPRNHYRRDTVTFDGTQAPAAVMSGHQLPTAPSPVNEGKGRLEVAVTATPAMTCAPTTSLLADVRSAFDEVDKIIGLSDRQKLSETKARIMALVSGKEREWAAFADQCEKDRLLKAQIADLKLSVAGRIAAKAERFCQICEECGIDFERILAKDSNAIHKLKVDALNETGRRTTTAVAAQSTPEGEAELARLNKERDQLADEVRQLENNYSNLFKLYEKMRENCMALKESEDNLKNDVSEQTKKYNSLYALYNELLNDAQDKLSTADLEVKRIEKENENKSLGIRMTLKRAQIQVKALEDALDAKTKENDELNKICNELLSKRESASMTCSTISELQD